LNKKLCILICLAALFASGCAQKWALDAQSLEAQLAWPQPPEKQRIRHVMTIRGFREKGGNVKGFLFGKGSSSLIKPVAVATGRDGRIAIADTGTKSVHLYIPKEELYIDVFSFDDGEMMASPVSVAFDDELRLYVSDSFYEKIAVFDSRGNTFSRLPGWL